MTYQAVDLFAGSGWGVACQRLGIEEAGVELMPEARATREANGMRTWLDDVWDVLETASLDSPEFRAALLIASPPCQTFSMAGGGKGRQALDEVVRLIDERAYLRTADLRAFGDSHDPRTALVLTPLAYIARHVPTYVVLEQVPPVLPVWERYAVELKRWGYSVAVGIVNAEQYGVPQTRRRAILVARADGREARLPVPTHSRYYSRDPKRLDEGVLPWVSMANALRRDDERLLFAGAGATANATSGQRQRPLDEPAHTITGKATGTFVLRSNFRTEVAEWPQSDRPAAVIQGDQRVPLQKHHSPESPQMDRALRLTVKEAAVLQSYPPDFPFQGGQGKRFLQIGNAVPPLMAEAILREVLS